MLTLMGKNNAWVLWVFRCIPVTAIAIGIVILVRQYQLWHEQE
jgi:hypothetical protein